MAEAQWTEAWLLAQVRSRSAAPDRQLLAIFELLDEEVRGADIRGCEGLLGGNQSAGLRAALSVARDIAVRCALAEPDAFAAACHAIMAGTLAVACEGDRSAGEVAVRVAEIVLNGWQRLAANDA